MRILLLGEMSGVHNYLRTGLKALGHDVVLYSNGDGYKNIQSDGVLFENFSDSNWFSNYQRTYRDSVKRASEYTGFDVVSFISTRIYPTLINKKIMDIVKSNNGIVSLISGGNDYALFKAYKNGAFQYYFMDYDDVVSSQYTSNFLKAAAIKNVEEYMAAKSNIIIPVLYDYWIGYKGRTNLHSVIPQPIDLSRFEYRRNEIRDKIVIFHGITREKVKGTPFIRVALQRIQETYGNKVEVILNGRMPQDEYLAVMNRANIVVDQCCCYGYGINANQAMAMGKIVLASNSDENNAALGVVDNPVFRITPDSDQIYEQLKTVIDQSDIFPMLGEKSRKYVEDYHDCRTVAQRYIDAWAEKQ